MKKTYIVPNATMIVIEGKNSILADSNLSLLSGGNGDDALSNEDYGWEDDDNDNTWKWPR